MRLSNRGGCQVYESKWRPKMEIGAGTRFWFVWSVWGLMLAAALGFVVRFGSNVPYWDEWSMVPALTGEEHIDAHWFWQDRNGHRVPIPRLFLLALYKLTGC